MKKIEKEMIDAIKAKKPYSNDNTRVTVSSEGDFIKVELHGHIIAEIRDKSVSLSDAGYQTKTTKSRLNCLLSHFKLPTLYSKKCQWYIEEDAWLGNKTFSLIMEGDLKHSLKYAAVLGGKEAKPREYDAVLGGKK